MADYHSWAIQQALYKIKEAEEKKYPWLVLERLGLSHIPKELFGLKHLKELVFIDNALTELSPRIGELQSLTCLNLFYNELTTIPAEISGLANLTHLDLSCNNIRELPPEIASLTNLEYLDLRFNKLPIPETEKASSQAKITTGMAAARANTRGSQGADVEIIRGTSIPK